MQRHEQSRQSCIPLIPCSMPHIGRSLQRSKWGLFLMPYGKGVAPLFGTAGVPHKKSQPPRTLP